MCNFIPSCVWLEETLLLCVHAIIFPFLSISKDAYILCPKCRSCHKAIMVITVRAHCFPLDISKDVFMHSLHADARGMYMVSMGVFSHSLVSDVRERSLSCPDEWLINPCWSVVCTHMFILLFMCVLLPEKIQTPAAVSMGVAAHPFIGSTSGIAHYVMPQWEPSLIHAAVWVILICYIMRVCTAVREIQPPVPVEIFAHEYSLGRRHCLLIMS